MAKYVIGPDVALRLAYEEAVIPFNAEYITLTQLQAEAFITLDAELASAVKGFVLLAPFEVLS